MVGSLALRPHFDSVLIRGPSRTLWLRLTVFCANLFRARPPTLLLTLIFCLLGLPDGRRRTPRTPHQVLPLCPARALSLCVFSTLPGLARSVGAVEHGGSRFLRPDPPPWQGAGVPARSPRRTSAPRAELPLSIHVCSDPFFFF